MSRYVLVPGAGGAAWYWSHVAPLLADAGHEVVAVELPGADDRAGLQEYADLVVSAAGTGPDIVLVAQSMGGFTAPFVCERLDVAQLVFVNAMIPVPGETAGNWGEHVGSGRARIAAAESGGYGVEFDEEVYFLHDVDPEIVAEGAEQQRPEAEIAFVQPCEFTAWPPVRTRVLVGADDRLFPAEFQRRVARERLGIEADVLPGGHLIALAQPDSVARYLLG